MNTISSRNWVEQMFGPEDYDSTPTAAVVGRGRKKPEELARSRRYNLAIWRLLNGKGSAAEEVSILTGLSVDAILKRQWRAENEAAQEELDSCSGVFTDDERRYLSKRYANMSDPAVKAFVAGVTQAERN